MTPDTLRAATGCTAERAALFAGPLSEACAAYGINTPERLAAFLAQIGHESGSLRYVREIASGAAYEGRKDLGNVQPGDGQRYRGRGLIQITGRYNYRRTTDRLHTKFGPSVPDFEDEPEALEQPRWAALSAADYWDAHILNVHADKGDFTTITRAINGGLNGQADRLARWERAKVALAADQAPVKQLPPASAIAQAPTQEPPMPPLIAALGQSLISKFAPLAAEKIQKEIERHTDNPAVAEQMTAAVVDAAIAVTGKADPIEAVAAAKTDPAVMAQIEQSALDKLAGMAPMLDKLAEMDAQAWAASEASFDSAAKRSASDWDMTPTLVYGALSLVALLVLFVCGIAVYQAVKADQIAPEVWAQVAGLIGFATGVCVTIFSFRFGTTRQSGAKDVLIGELSKRKAAP